MQVKNKQRQPNPLPPDSPIARLRALADRVEALRSELDGHLDEYAKLITPPRVPTVNIRQMIDARGVCICQSSLFAIAERVAALELEQKALENSA
jgi:hypothetical protein